MSARYKEAGQEVRKQRPPLRLHISEPFPEVLLRRGRRLKNNNSTLYSSNVEDLLVIYFLLKLRDRSREKSHFFSPAAFYANLFL